MMSQDDLKNLLLQQLADDKDKAREILEKLTDHNWLRDGTLRGADFSGVDLWAAYLGEADLQQANFTNADLSEIELNGADLSHACFMNADLGYANLDRAMIKGTDFRGANLEGASFFLATVEDALFDVDTVLPDGTKWSMGRDLKDFTHPPAQLENYRQELVERLVKVKGANAIIETLDNLRERGWIDTLRGLDLQGNFFTGANLQGADLRGANLTNAHLEGANLEGVQFDEMTILPDGSAWTAETDLSRFSDADHPDFFRPPGYWYGDEG